MTQIIHDIAGDPFDDSPDIASRSPHIDKVRRGVCEHPAILREVFVEAVAEAILVFVAFAGIIGTYDIVGVVWRVYFFDVPATP